MERSRVVPRQLPVEEVEVGGLAAQLQLVLAEAGAAFLEQHAVPNVVAGGANHVGDVVNVSAEGQLIGGGGQQPAVHMGRPAQAVALHRVGRVTQL